MKKNIAILYGYNIFGKQSKNKINKQLRFIELFPEYNFYFLNHTPRRSIKSVIDSSLPMEIINLDNYLLGKSWHESNKKINQIFSEYDIDECWTVCMPLLESKIAFNAFNKICDRDDYMTNMLMPLNHLRKINIVKQAVERNIHVRQFIDDPFEFNVKDFNQNNNRYYFLNNIDDAKYLPTIEYGYLYANSARNITKQYDFTVGFKMHASQKLNKNDYRKQISKKFANLKFPLNTERYKLFIKDADYGFNSIIQKNKYDEYIDASYFTLILPSINNQHISYIRFVEALKSRCIPLFYWEHKETVLKIFSNIFPHFGSILEKYNLFTDIDNLDEVIAANKIIYGKIINEFISCSDYQKLINKDYYNVIREEILK